MCFRCLSFLLLGSALCAQPLRVCADPDNMPYSNQAGEGFENKLAQLVASELGTSVDYVWLANGGLSSSKCDLVLGIPSSMNSVLTTQPYYRSSYVFVSRVDRNLRVTSLLDPKLASLKIGVDIVGNDYAPPAAVLARRGITNSIVPFASAEPARIIEAVQRGDVDIAIVWGPIAGYFSKQSKAPLIVEPVSPTEFAGIPFVFDISMGVHKGDDVLKAKLDRVIRSDAGAIQQILAEYNVPEVH